MQTTPSTRAANLLTGIGVGAALMYLADPNQGRRRRALVRDQVVRAFNKTDDAVRVASRDLANRTRGTVAEARGRIRSQRASDDVLVQRARAELGRVVSHPSAIYITAEQGRLVVSGPILADEVEQLLSRLRSVRGVKDVENRLDVHESAEGVPGLQGGSGRPASESELTGQSWTPAARLLAGASGGALLLAGVRRGGVLGTALGVAGAALAARGITNRDFGRRARANGALRVQKTIEIDAPLEQVFAFFTEWENWPRFMSHVREVRNLGGGRTHWVVDGPAGVPVEWDAVVTELTPNHRIVWRSIEGSTVDHSGRLRFEPTSGGGTRVNVQMSYSPPAGAAGHAVAALFGVDPKSELDDDLARLKTTIETGRPPRDAAERASHAPSSGA